MWSVQEEQPVRLGHEKWADEGHHWPQLRAVHRGFVESRETTGHIIKFVDP